MRKVVNIACVIALLSAATSLAAQSDFKKGYIITAKGEKVEGWVDYRDDFKNATQCTFKHAPDDEKTHYTPEELAGYGFENGKHYEARQIFIEARNDEETDQTANRFLEVLAKGKANLYYTNPL